MPLPMAFAPIAAGSAPTMVPMKQPRMASISVKGENAIEKPSDSRHVGVRLFGVVSDVEFDGRAAEALDLGGDRVARRVVGVRGRRGPS